MPLLELIGDSARGDDFAMVRLLVESGRIVDADAPGLERSLTGLSLLEAAAVPGETLAADALANAIAPVFAAAHEPGRIAVAMSGGVDSAVALLRAAPNAIGVTLRLWLDPAGPSSERACCSPDAVIAARETCHRLGLPHVTLDLRDAFRSAVVRPFVEGYAQGLTPNPCMRCNGQFRFDTLVAFANRAGADVLWTGHYARIVERGGLRLIARGTDVAKDQSYMLATVDPALLDRVAFPLGAQGKRSTRDEAASAGLAVAERAESQEACFLAGDDYRSFLRRAGTRPPGLDRSSTSRGSSSVVTTASGATRRGSVAESGSRRQSRSLPSAPTRPRTRSWSGPAARSRSGTWTSVGASTCPSSGPRRSCAIGPSRCPHSSSARRLDSALTLEQPASAVAPGQVAVLYDDEAIVGAGMIVAATG